MKKLIQDQIAIALQQLRAQSQLIAPSQRFFRSHLSPNLQDLPFIQYDLEPARANMNGIGLIPVVETTNPEGLLGIEIVSPDHQIVCQATLPLSQTQAYAPVYFSFPAIPHSHQGIFALRVFGRHVSQPVHILEYRALPFARGWRRWRTRALCGLKFAERMLAPLDSDGTWCVLDEPRGTEVNVAAGVLSFRGWAWSRETGCGQLWIEIENDTGIARYPVVHRYCRFDVSQAIPEIPLANYAGFEFSIDRCDLPERCRATLVFETSAGEHRHSPINVTASHSTALGVIRDVVCDCCSGVALTLVGKKDGLEIRQCDNCGLVFTSPRPDFSIIQQRYSDDYFQREYLPEIHTLFEERRKHWNNILDTVERFKNINNHLFEVGTGAGYLLREAARRGWVASGIDLSPAAVQYAKQLGLDVFAGNILETNLPANAFGAILLESTLEHFTSPRQVLENCVRALHPGGGIFIWTLGNEGDLMTTLGMDFKYVGPSEHLYYFPASALIRLCESVGLRVDTFWRDSTFDSVALVATKRIDR